MKKKYQVFNTENLDIYDVICIASYFTEIKANCGYSCGRGKFFTVTTGQPFVGIKNPFRYRGPWYRRRTTDIAYLWIWEGSIFQKLHLMYGIRVFKKELKEIAPKELYEEAYNLVFKKEM